eukprot:scaffold216108_cov37-Tisochrysis_lutea.AAC.2
MGYGCVTIAFQPLVNLCYCADLKILCLACGSHAQRSSSKPLAAALAHSRLWRPPPACGCGARPRRQLARNAVLAGGSRSYRSITAPPASGTAPPPPFRASLGRRSSSGPTCASPDRAGKGKGERAKGAKDLRRVFDKTVIATITTIHTSQAILWLYPCTMHTAHHTRACVSATSGLWHLGGRYQVPNGG